MFFPIVLYAGYCWFHRTANINIVVGGICAFGHACREILFSGA